MGITQLQRAHMQLAALNKRIDREDTARSRNVWKPQSPLALSRQSAHMNEVSALQEKLQRLHADKDRLTPLQRAQEQLTEKKTQLAALPTTTKDIRGSIQQFGRAIQRGQSGALAAASQRRGEGKLIDKVEKNTKETASLLKDEIEQLKLLVGILSGQDVKIVSLGV